MYGEIIEDLRDGLKVTAEHDRTIARGLRKAARQLLMVYNFREAVRRSSTVIAGGANYVPLPADAGKIKAVHIRTIEGGTSLFKPIRRRGEGQLPVHAGPNFYFTEGANLFLDQPLPVILATPYYIDVWYQSTDPDINESWLSTTYESALEHLAGSKLAMKLNKAEAAQTYAMLWQQDTAILARFTSELEFSDMDMGMGEQRQVALERYPA